MRFLGSNSTKICRGGGAPPGGTVSSQDPLAGLKGNIGEGRCGRGKGIMEEGKGR